MGNLDRFIRQLDGTYAVIIHPINGYLEPEQLETIWMLTKQYGRAKLTVSQAIMIYKYLFLGIDAAGRW